MATAQVATKCHRCGYQFWTGQEGQRSHACPEDRPELARALAAARRYLRHRLDLHQRLLQSVDWGSRDPDALPIQELERLLEDVRAARALADLLRSAADEAAQAVARTLVGLRQERQRRLDKEFEWPTEYPPAPVV